MPVVSNRISDAENRRRRTNRIVLVIILQILQLTLNTRLRLLPAQFFGPSNSFTLVCLFASRTTLHFYDRIL